MTVDHRRLARLSRMQSGVIARRQLVECGLSAVDLRRQLRRRELVAAAPGVYVDHTGLLSWRQREWVAVLGAWPAALCCESVLPGMRPVAVNVAIAHGRALGWLPGTVVHRMAQLDERVSWRSAPPRVHVEHAVVDVMCRLIGEGDVPAAYAALTRACFATTSPARIERVLGLRSRVAGRETIAAMLADVRTGACSVLERGYLHRVEGAHGLPRGTRQRVSVATGVRTVPDVRYEPYGVVVELDGRVIHDRPESWDADARRDLAELAVSRAVTARVTYGLVFGGQCATAAWIGQILQRQGWPGRPTACPLCPSGA